MAISNLKKSSFFYDLKKLIFFFLLNTILLPSENFEKKFGFFFSKSKNYFLNKVNIIELILLI